MNLLRLFLLLVVCFAMLMVSGCDSADDDEPILMRVGERAVALKAFQQEFREAFAEDAKVSSGVQQQLVRTYLRRVLDREMILAEADRLGIDVTPEELNRVVAEATGDYPPGEFRQELEQRGLSEELWRRNLNRSLRVEKTIAAAMGQVPEADDAAIEAYYRENEEDFKQSKRIRLRQIVVHDEEIANEVLGLLRQGADFAELAREHSDVPDTLGDEQGWLEPGLLPPEIDDKVFTLPAGRVSEPVSSPYGFHLFLVEESQPPGQLTLEQARPDILERLREASEEKAFRNWLGHLRAEIPIQVDWELLAEIE
ncbi:MAG: hypothetical protein C0616_02435 [Desulfuromonas sp.]|nr:MAG: hypothetical protein C0616_02435 [Desulfuromonas sp.]